MEPLFSFEEMLANRLIEAGLHFPKYIPINKVKCLAEITENYARQPGVREMAESMVKQYGKELRYLASLPTTDTKKTADKTSKPISAYTFAGLMLSSTPLTFNGKEFALSVGWNANSFGKAFGKKKGSTYFNWHECHDVNIEGWRVPTREEWAAIVGTVREGSVYNGQAKACFALIQVDVPFGEREVCNGLLLFPDGASINGVVIDNVNKTCRDKNYKQTRGITEEQLNNLLAQGCAFLPASGYYCDDGDWGNGGFSGHYWSSTEFDEYDAYLLDFDFDYLYPDDYDFKSGIYYSVWLVQE